MLKKIDEVLFVVFMMVTCINVARTDMMTKELYEEAQAYRESIESTVYTDTMDEEEIVQKYLEYSGEGSLIYYNGTYTDSDGDVWYECVTSDDSSTYIGMLNFDYVNNYVNYELQQEQLAEL